jgi:hypothetical protein
MTLVKEKLHSVMCPQGLGFRFFSCDIQWVFVGYPMGITGMYVCVCVILDNAFHVRACMRLPILRAWMVLELMFYVGFVGNQLFSKLLYRK